MLLTRIILASADRGSNSEWHCLDEKAQIQALDRTRPDSPDAPQGASRHVGPLLIGAGRVVVGTQFCCDEFSQVPGLFW